MGSGYAADKEAVKSTIDAEIHVGLLVGHPAGCYRLRRFASRDRVHSSMWTARMRGLAPASPGSRRLPPAVHRWLERIAFLLSSIMLLGLALLEGGLRIAASLVGPRCARPADGGGRSSVLATQTRTAFTMRPTRLTLVISGHAGCACAGRYRVLKLGLPGMNSSQIVPRLPGGSIGIGRTQWSLRLVSTIFGFFRLQRG